MRSPLQVKPLPTSSNIRVGVEFEATLSTSGLVRERKALAIESKIHDSGPTRKNQDVEIPRMMDMN